MRISNIEQVPSASTCAGLISGSGRFFQPLPGGLDIANLEVPELGEGEWFANLCHPLLPLFIADERDPLHVGTMLGGELGVIPERLQVPAVEIFEPGQQTDFALGLDSSFHDGNKVFVILIVQLSAYLKAKNLSRALFELFDHRFSKFSFHGRVHAHRGEFQSPQLRTALKAS
jgi:hypothetical protein